MLQSMGLQRVRHDLVTEQQQRKDHILRVKTPQYLLLLLFVCVCVCVCVCGVGMETQVNTSN